MEIRYIFKLVQVSICHVGFARSVTSAAENAPPFSGCIPEIPDTCRFHLCLSTLERVSWHLLERVSMGFPCCAVLQPFAISSESTKLDGEVAPEHPQHERQKDCESQFQIEFFF